MSMRRLATTLAEAPRPASATTAAQPMCDLMPSATFRLAAVSSDAASPGSVFFMGLRPPGRGPLRASRSAGIEPGWFHPRSPRHSRFPDAHRATRDATPWRWPRCRRPTRAGAPGVRDGDPSPEPPLLERHTSVVTGILSIGSDDGSTDGVTGQVRIDSYEDAGVLTAVELINELARAVAGSGDAILPALARVLAIDRPSVDRLRSRDVPGFVALARQLRG